MQKIKILNKEFEVGDMVELDIGQKHIGYIREINGVSEFNQIFEPHIRFGGCQNSDIDEFTTAPVIIESITSIKKLVYEQ